MLGQHGASYMVLCLLMLDSKCSKALFKGYILNSSWIIEQLIRVACGGTLLHIMPQGHGIGGPWWVEMVS